MSLADDEEFAVIRQKVKDCRDQLRAAKHKNSMSLPVSRSTPPPIADSHWVTSQD